MKTDVWVPIYIGDYLADTTRLTTLQHGAYFLLILDYWRNGPPPDNDAILAQITRCSEHDWGINRAALEQYFEVVDGRWTHGRIEKELAAAGAKKTAAVSKAKAAADARWKTRNDAPSNSTSNAPSIQQALLGSCPSPSPSPVESKALATDVAPAAAPSRPTIPNCPAEDLVEIYHACLPANPACKVLNDKRRSAMRARWKEWFSRGKYANAEEGIAWWAKLFTYAATSRFLTGQVPRPGRDPWFADIDFLFSPDGNVGLVEGKYHDGVTA